MFCCMVCYVFSAAVVNLCLQRCGFLIQLLYEQETPAQLSWQICNTYKMNIHARLPPQPFANQADTRLQMGIFLCSL